MQLDQEQDTRRDAGISVDDLELSTFELHPEGLYRAKFAAAKVVDIDFKDGKGTQRKVELEFQTSAKKENGEFHTVSKVSAYSLSPKASIRPLLKAVGVNVEQIVPSSFKLTAYLGQQLALNIIHEPSKKDPSVKHAVIGAFLPKEAAPTSKKAQQQAPPPPPPAEEDNPFDDVDE